MTVESTAIPFENCPYCGGRHKGIVCPKIRAIEYFENGTVKRVEFHGPQSWPQNAFPPQVWPNAGHGMQPYQPFTTS
jgi:hypothetical protein